MAVRAIGMPRPCAGGPDAEMPYLNVVEVESALQLVTATHPGFTELVTLPHRTWENRVCRAVRCYDALPIIDVFRKVDDDTVVGAMDLRGLETPFMFVLRRDLG